MGLNFLTISPCHACRSLLSFQKSSQSRLLRCVGSSLFSELSSVFQAQSSTIDFLFVESAAAAVIDVPIYHAE